MPEAFLGLEHIGVAVADLDAAAKAFGEVLGLRVTHAEELPDRGLAVVFVDAGDCRLELMGATRTDSEISSFLGKRGEGLHHICIRVADLDKTLVEMKTRGARLINETPVLGAHGRRVAFIHPKSACGVLVELVEEPHATHP